MAQKADRGDAGPRIHLRPRYFFSGDLEMGHGKALCVIGADWYGLDLLSAIWLLVMEGMWRMLPLPTWKKQTGSLGPRITHSAGLGD